MNKKIHDIILKYQVHPRAYQKKNSAHIVLGDNLSLVIKLKHNNYDIYKYLLSRDFLFFPHNLNSSQDDYDVLEYIDDLSISEEQKINDYLNILAVLHQKTSYKREIDLDEIKEKYENLTNRISYLQKYYHNLNDLIDQKNFFSPAEYLLVRNISLIYQVLEKALIILNELYDKNKEIKSIRVSLLHNNIDINHLLENSSLYLISWDQAYFSSPVYELESFYRNYYSYMELDDLLKNYEKINKLSKEEEKLLLILLAMPKEIKLTNDTFLDTDNINKEINYLNKIYKLLINSLNKS